MKKDYHSCLTAILFAFVFGFSPQAGAASESPFVVKVTSAKKVYLIGEPVTLNLIIENVTPNAIEATHPLDSGEYNEEIQVRLQGTVEFYPVPTQEAASDALIDRAGPLPKLKWSPRGKVTRKEIILCWRLSIPRHEKGEMIFAKPGDYIFRCRVGFNSSTATEEVTISVAEPTRQVDRDALAWLKQRDFLCDLQSLPYRNPAMSDRLRRPQELQEKYGTSVYAEFLRSLAQPAPAAPQTGTNSRSPSAMAGVVKDLETALYDVKGFARHSPEGNTALVGIVIKMHEELIHDKLSQEEFDRRHAELLKRYIMEYSQPLSPEEWKRRYEGYAKEEAEKLRQQELDKPRIIEMHEKYLRENRKDEKKKE